MPFMRALSVCQPWAWLIVNGYKPIENRTWKLDYRGPLVIHASKKLGQEQLDDVMHIQHTFPQIRLPPIRDMQMGGIVGLVDVIDCISESKSPWFSGPFGFVLANPKRCTFQPLPGRLGLFPVHEHQVRPL